MAALARWTGHVVARSGAQTDLLVPLAQQPLPPLSMANCQSPPALSQSLASAALPPTQLPACEEFKVTSVTVSGLNETDSTANVEIETTMQLKEDQKLFLKIGDKVIDFKGSDAKREGDTSRWIITAAVPTSLLRSNPNVRASRPAGSDVDEGNKYCYNAISEAQCEPFKINSVTTAPLNETNSTVRVEISTTMLAMFDHELLLEIGGKVFGLKDAIVKRERNQSGPIITAVVPTALLVSNPSVRVFRPFWSDMDGDGKHCYDNKHDLTEFGQDSAAERLVFVSVDTNGNAVYLMYGNGLDHAKLLVPEKDASLEAVDGIAGGRIRLLRIKKSLLQTTKKVVIQKEDKQRPLLLDLPDAKTTAAKVSVDSPVILNTEEIDVSIEQADDVGTVKLDEKVLKWKPVDKSTIRLLNLKADGVTNEQKSREITIEYKNGAKAALKFEVVAARIGVK
jgi:hypothetical protein